MLGLHSFGHNLEIKRVTSRVSGFFGSCSFYRTYPLILVSNSNSSRYVSFVVKESCLQNLLINIYICFIKKENNLETFYKREWLNQTCISYMKAIDKLKWKKYKLSFENIWYAYACMYTTKKYISKQYQL